MSAVAPTVAIIIPSITVNPLLERCVAECRRCSPDAEILVYVDDDAGAEVLDPSAVVVRTGPITIAAKRNLGAAATTAEYLAFIDSDAYPSDGWPGNGVAALEADATWDAIGGPNISPPVETRSERHVGLAHKSPLVAGWWVYRRQRDAHAREVGSLPSCNLIVRRAAYDAVGGMNEELFTAEDTDFCRRFCADGRRIHFSPDVLVFHKNRNLRAFVVQRFTFGAAMFPLLKLGAAPSAAYTAASAVLALFSIFLATGPVGLFVPFWGWLWLAVVAVYAVVLVVEGVRQSERPSDLGGTIVALFIGNLAPGVGFVLKALRLSPDLRGVYRNDR